MGKMYYKNIFIYSSLQSTGNAEKYFAAHTEKLVVFVLTSRQEPNSNLLRIYKKGKLTQEKKITLLTTNIFFYYLLWYINYISIILNYFTKKEKVIVISWHPISFFGMSLQKMIRNIDFVFWNGDYFPPVKLSLVLYEKLKKYYNNNVKYACYQSDLINEKMNGKVLDTRFRKTLPWGIIPRNIKRVSNGKKFTLLFVGVVRESQGLEFLFEFLKNHKEYSLKVLGVCTKDLYQKYKTIINKNKIDSQIYFPNRFVSDSELEEESKTCQAGIAVYDVDWTNATFYTDPGKVKTYASLGLPIIMTDVSAIVPYIKRFGCGRVIKKEYSELENALLDIKNNYKGYLAGLAKFNKYFYYDTYYKKRFQFLENNDK